MIGTILLAAALAGAAPGEVASGTPIVSIVIRTGNVFDLSDPATSSWPYRTANSLHITSKERFIRSLLLFHEGDPLDYSILAETERLLRATGFLNPVTIIARPGRDGAEVVVDTRDQWTTEVSFNYGKVGNQVKYGLLLSEQNFLGWGKEVAFDFTDDPERTSYTLKYADPVFLGTRWRLRASLKDASDGTGSRFSLTYPFFSYDTDRAGGVDWEHDTLTEYLYVDGKRAVSGDASHRRARIWGGLRVVTTDITTDRLSIGLFAEEHSFAGWERRDGSDYGDPEDRDMVGFDIGWQRENDNWAVVSGFRGWTNQEDVAIGPNWEGTVGFSLAALGGDENRFPFRGRYYQGWLDGSRYQWVHAHLRGRVDESQVNSVVTHLEAGIARIGEVGWRARLALDLGYHLGRDEQLTLGANTGLRGWNPDTFDGDSRAVANLEWRHRLTGEVLHLAVFGFTGFVDVGGSWGGRVGRDSDGVRADIGVGLLAEITRASILRVIRFEVAFPDDGSGPVWLATSGSIF